MAESSPAAPRPPAGRHSTGMRFAMTVAVPVAGLAVLWTGTALAILGSRTARRMLGLPDHPAAGELALFAGGGVLVVAITVMLAGLFARRLSRDVSGIAAAARLYADEMLPQLVMRLRGGLDEPPPVTPALPVPRSGSTEIAQAVAAIARLEQAAAAAAAGEAGLRDGLRSVFVSLARRNQSLLQRQLRLIDALEQKASDPVALADLFTLDHLTTRMRRHAESLAILAGAAPGRSWTEPVPVIDVIRAATAEVEDYQRVVVLSGAEDAVAAPAVADMIHLLAELIENATMFSPSGTRVEVKGERVANGFAIEIEDRGLGIDPGQLGDLNRQLADPPDFDLANADRLGLFVGAKLAVRHGVRVSLRPSPYGGTRAIVLMPGGIVVPPARLSRAPGAVHRAEDHGRLPGLDLRSAGAPGMTAPRPRAEGLVPAPPAGGQLPPAGTNRRLPQRTRQASLSPHLRGPDGSRPDGSRPDGSRPDAAPAPAGLRSPEQARDLAASLQTGWRRGREEPPAGPAAEANALADGNEPPATHGGEA